MQPQKIIMTLKIFLPLYKYYDIDEMHNVGIPTKNKSVTVPYKCMLFKKNFDDL